MFVLSFETYDHIPLGHVCLIKMGLGLLAAASNYGLSSVRC